MIYTGTRYKDTRATARDGTLVFTIRKIYDFDPKNCIVHVFTRGETIEQLAYKNYGDTQLAWAIMEANPQYSFEFEIQPGDEILIPTKQELSRVYV